MISSSAILSTAAKSYGLKISDLIGNRMFGSYVSARFLTIALLQEFRPELNPSQIAHLLHRDRATVKYLLIQVSGRLDRDSILAQRFAEARTALGAGLAISVPVVTPKVDHRQKAKLERRPDETMEEFCGRIALRNSENGLLLALRDAHPELECVAFQTQGPL